MRLKNLSVFILIFISLPLSAMMHKSLNRQLADAVKTGNIEEVESCLMRGANPNVKTDKCRMPRPLLIAAKKGLFEIAQLLLKYHANINARNNLGQTALIFAAANGYTGIVKLFLDYHAIVDTQDNFGNTALMLASGNGRTEIVKILLAHNADINIIDTHGYTTLHHAMRGDQPMIVNILLKQSSITDTYKQRALIFGGPRAIEPFLKYIFAQTRHNPEIWHLWDQYILSALNEFESQYRWPWPRVYPIQTINAFRMLLHHADKLPLSRKKLVSLTTNALRIKKSGESAFRKTIEHLRKKAF